MKLLYVVQAYGLEVFGGAESHCRLMATRMAQRGHDVEVVTSCASHYETWENTYQAGTSVFDDVTVHRFAVDRAREVTKFGKLSGRVMTGYKPVPLFLQQDWIEQQGPHVPALLQWLDERAHDYDVVVFFTYLYYPTVRGLPVVSGRVPTVLHPLAHDEAPFYLDVYDTVLKFPDGLAYSVEEDQALVERRAWPKRLQEVIGIGTDLQVTGDESRFRKQFGLSSEPYLVCVGRVDSHKGSYDLLDYFEAYKARNPSSLKLVFLGECVAGLREHDDVVITGWVDGQTRTDALLGAVASVHPSYFESFSMTLVEAWALRCPAVVNARCDVLAGQAARSGGALPYDGFAEFEESVTMLLVDQQLGRLLGASGRSYVERRYHWDRVMDRYEEFLQRVISCSPRVS